MEPQQGEMLDQKMSQQKLLEHMVLGMKADVEDVDGKPAEVVVKI